MESHSGGLPKVLSKLWNSSYKYAMLEQEDGWKNMMQPLICLNLRGQSCPWMLARPIYGPGDRRSYNFNFNDVFFSRCLRTGEARAVTGCGQGVQCDVWQVAGAAQLLALIKATASVVPVSSPRGRVSALGAWPPAMADMATAACMADHFDKIQKVKSIRLYKIYDSWHWIDTEYITIFF